jgi:hypothetical protein
MITYEQFQQQYKLHHTCGYPFLPYELTYSSDCPLCEPNSQQWKDRCQEEFNLGHINHKGNGIWSRI